MAEFNESEPFPNEVTVSRLSEGPNTEWAEIARIEVVCVPIRHVFETAVNLVGVPLDRPGWSTRGCVQLPPAQESVSLSGLSIHKIRRMRSLVVSMTPTSCTPSASSTTNPGPPLTDGVLFQDIRDNKWSG